MSHSIAPPASWDPPPHAVVIGAGIAGLTAAHELRDRGFRVTVYEPKHDERSRWQDPQSVPAVKLGGLASSQYAVAMDGEPGDLQLRQFPRLAGRAQLPTRPVAGEHGFRFFPAYYLHIWDTLMRIPVYEAVGGLEGGTPEWRRTSRTVFDNVKRVVTQAVTTKTNSPTLIFPRELPNNPAEFITTIQQVLGFGFQPSDIQTFAGRLLRYLVTSHERRRAELQQISAYEFFEGLDGSASAPISYSPDFTNQLLDMPKVLAAFDSKWGDARTNISTFLQLQFQMDRRDNKADGVLNGPTTDAWFDHWYRLLVELGVEFVNSAVRSVLPPSDDRLGLDPLDRPRASVLLDDGTEVHPDYVVVAVDAPAAEAVTADLRAAGVGGTVAQLAGYASSTPPEDGPRQPAARRTGERRNPYVLDSMGRLPWDRFQTLTGIQYFFNTEFQLVRGHVYYTDTDWALSSINQHGLWERRPTLEQDGYVSVLSVDIGDWNAPAKHAHDPAVQGLAPRDCTPDQIAVEVWNQIARSITNTRPDEDHATLPTPAWYTIDRNLEFELRADGSEGVAVLNRAPYLVPIVADWDSRPGGYPWNPNESSPSWVPFDEDWEDDLYLRDVWQARHGGYQVHNNSVVFAGTWTKTFTRMTSMEAACESGRHAVNAILDHAIWLATEGEDRRETKEPLWKIPFGFLDQDGSVATRIPTPLGDYCFVFDLENREPLEVRSTRTLDSEAFARGLPHPWDALGVPGMATPGGPGER